MQVDFSVSKKKKKEKAHHILHVHGIRAWITLILSHSREDVHASDMQMYTRVWNP